MNNCILGSLTQNTTASPWSLLNVGQQGVGAALLNRAVPQDGVSAEGSAGGLSTNPLNCGLFNLQEPDLAGLISALLCSAVRRLVDELFSRFSLGAGQPAQ